VLLAVAAVAVVATVTLAWIWVAPCALGGCAPVADFAQYQAEGSELLDIDDQPIGMLATVNRRIVPLDSLPPHVPQAFIAVEDRRFYSHGGLDLFRLGGAMVSNIEARGVAEGGSTITMQLARNLFPEWLPYTDRSMRRKLLEARVARQMEREFSKDKILELYLNHIYLGNGAYGIEAASLAYFGKPASELSVVEAATLGGLPKAPSDLDPTRNPEGARERRDLVLGEMVQAGFITREQAEAARSQPIALSPAERNPQMPRGSYFVERVRREMQELAGNHFYTAGLRVYTTLDSNAQRAAEEELGRQLDAIEAGRFGSFPHPTYPESRGQSETTGQTPYLQGAVVLLDATTGEVRALVGGRDFDDSKFDRALQAQRQPGSAFKPFVFLRALQLYGTPAHPVEDTPVRMVLSNGQVWEPRNYTGTFEGRMTLREALARSKNTVTVRISQEVGMSAVIRTAHDLGISSPIDNVPASALGAAEVRPIELAQAYAPLANGGNRVEPRFIRRIVDRHGNVLWEARPTRRKVVDEAAAFVLTTMLQDVIDRGTGNAVRGVGFSGAAAGKTGTTNSATDVWFVGYTPDLVGAVWMGFDTPKTIIRGASGGTLAAPAWGRIMRRVYAERPTPQPWSPPPGVTRATVHTATGYVIDDGCPAQGPTHEEYFLRGTRPSVSCAPEPRYTYRAGTDFEWVDEEWDLGGTYSDTLSAGGEVEPGIYWPELESLRRRIQTQPAPGAAQDTLGTRPPTEPGRPQQRPAGMPERTEPAPTPATGQPAETPPAETAPADAPAGDESQLLGDPVGDS
jgi:penicillin-binding protein 1A